jgi:hypothetical protein
MLWYGPYDSYQTRKVYADEAKGAESLQVGSFARIAKTLAVLGCDINTVNCFRTTRTRPAIAIYLLVNCSLIVLNKLANDD